MKDYLSQIICFHFCVVCGQAWMNMQETLFFFFFFRVTRQRCKCQNYNRQLVPLRKYNTEMDIYYLCINSRKIS